ncbi:hypothetical protein KHQ08_09350 [Pseudochrobactrum algeriensis]|uniref:hypothetical protein n=1 Tax=Pseudochrobactrum algeriensis TaxID=2834768 RepID=UPI001BD030E1|nr:hypothetical protein [Pseudochrobactrum algeriensis]QVQ38161.1 hypothetical protein KHQ08_09350 [Pseudochrobactrum algeriensis]QVQ41387.1 hypothetical protein KHQ07_07655 [Pseudochrobactrum algeriensis]QVQ45309.1 hypothetical protein KHQ09_09610 [Pseudochrobactrum algeriensis]
MTNVNLCLEFIKIAPSVIIGISVGYIAYKQWRTAHQKVVFDLFERRLKIYNEIIDVVGSSLSEKRKLSTATVSLHILDIYHSSRFLFGNEVCNAIFEIKEVTACYGFAYQQLQKEKLSDEEREKINNISDENYKKILSFKETFTALCLPYMLMNQKRVRTLSEWLHDKNKQRLSYSDQERL